VRADGLSKNPNTPTDILAKLAEHPDRFVRMYVGINLSTPASALDKLAEDVEPNVVLWMILNPNTPIKTLRRLAKSEVTQVRERAVEELGRRGAGLE